MGSEFSDRVPQNVKLPQAQRRFQRVVKVLHDQTHGEFVYRPLQFHERSQYFMGVHNETLFRPYDRATAGVLVAVGVAACVALAVAVDVADAVVVAVGRGVAVAVAITVAVAVALGVLVAVSWLLRLANH